MSRTVAVHADLLDRDGDPAAISQDGGTRSDGRPWAQEALNRDPLTGLLNRAAFIRRLDDLLDTCPVPGPMTLLVADLDRFRLLNEGLDHPSGDRVLVRTARLLSSRMPAPALVGRTGDDEFAALLPGGHGTGVATVDALRRDLQALDIGGSRVAMTATVGMADANGGASASTLLQQAEVALHAAKQAGGDRVELFREELRRRVQSGLELDVDLREALRTARLDVHYQPAYDAKSGRPVGVEALARWQHPRRGAVPPSEFIAIAEQSELITRLDAYVLDRAVVDQNDLSRALGADDTTIWVNVSPRDLERPEFVELLMSRAGEAGAGRLGIEITERVLAHDRGAAAEALWHLHASGLRTAVDDFGTGYSSLAGLSTLPVDVIKLDRSLIAGLTSAKGVAVVRATIGLAREIGARSCAEGIETSDELTAMQRLGVDEVSGYHLCPPQPLLRLLPRAPGSASAVRYRLQRAPLRAAAAAAIAAARAIPPTTPADEPAPRIA